MRFLRSLRGSERPEGSPRPSPDADEGLGLREPELGRDEEPEIRGDGEPDDEARAADATDAFEAGLSDLARRQERYSRYAWRPPGQTDRRGRWMVTGTILATRDDGRVVGLQKGETLELAEAPTSGRAADGDRLSWRFRRVQDGRLVDIDAAVGGAWPATLARPGAEGSEGR